MQEHVGSAENSSSDHFNNVNTSDSDFQEHRSASRDFDEQVTMNRKDEQPAQAAASSQKLLDKMQKDKYYSINIIKKSS